MSDDSVLDNIDYAEWPAVLRKAVHDQWRYAVRLQNGELIIFGIAEIEGDWITLRDIDYWSDKHIFQNSGEIFIWTRGLCVHKSQIVWCADCDS